MHNGNGYSMNNNGQIDKKGWFEHGSCKAGFDKTSQMYKFFEITNVINFENKEE